jgi:hypothetical protein
MLERIIKDITLFPILILDVCVLALIMGLLPWRFQLKNFTKNNKHEASEDMCFFIFQAKMSLDVYSDPRVCMVTIQMGR